MRALISIPGLKRLALKAPLSLISTSTDRTYRAHGNPKSPYLSQLIPRYPVVGDNIMEKGYPKFVVYEYGAPSYVYINKTQYFKGVPKEVWEFHVGVYQVCEKWLKDRRSRQLSFDDLMHYQKVIVALKETIRLMEEIDRAIPGWPIE